MDRFNQLAGTATLDARVTFSPDGKRIATMWSGFSRFAESYRLDIIDAYTGVNGHVYSASA